MCTIMGQLVFIPIEDTDKPEYNVFSLKQVFILMQIKTVLFPLFVER